MQGAHTSMEEKKLICISHSWLLCPQIATIASKLPPSLEEDMYFRVIWKVSEAYQKSTLCHNFWLVPSFYLAEYALT